MSKQTTRPTPFGPSDRSEEPLFCVQPCIPIEHALEHASYVLGTARAHPGSSRLVHRTPELPELGQPAIG